MSYVKTRIGKYTQRTFETGSLVILIVLLALPFTKAFADDFRRGGGPGIYGAVSVQGWRLGGDYRKGGYEIYRWTRGGWYRMPGRGVQLGGNSRSPWVINSQGERYQWTGGDWHFIGYGAATGSTAAMCRHRASIETIAGNGLTIATAARPGMTVATTTAGQWSSCNSIVSSGNVTV